MRSVGVGDHSPRCPGDPIAGQGEAEAAADALSAVSAALAAALAEHVPRFVSGVGAVGAVGGDLTVRKRR